MNLVNSEIAFLCVYHIVVMILPCHKWFSNYEQIGQTKSSVSERDKSLSDITILTKCFTLNRSLNK